METGSWLLQLFLCACMLAPYGSRPASDLFEVDVRRLAAVWEKEHISPADPYALTHAGLLAQLERLAADFPDLMGVEEAGRSVEGRAIFIIRAGSGQEKILLWSQMHGDEPTATGALLDILQFLGTHREEPWVRRILDQYTLLIVPMLNPDGAERMQRRNAQGIDINRDARALQTPEGRLLKEIRDRYRPLLGFNLHNQNSTTTVGDTGRVATIALLAVAADAPARAGTLPADPAPAAIAKRVTAVLYEALSHFAYGHVSRYDEEFNPRAFGDNLTLWGTPVVLIESGGNPGDQPANFGVKLNFVGLLAALDSLASRRIENANPAVFDALKLNSSSPIYDLLLQNGWIFTGTGIPLFRGDIAVRGDFRAGNRGQAIIADLGDLGVYTAHRTIDCSSSLVTPGLIAWVPETSPRADVRNDRVYLERGFLTLLETVRLPEVRSGHPPAPQWLAEPRMLNWSYLIAGDLSETSEGDRLRLAQWLSAGGRGVVADPASGLGPEIRELAGWFSAAGLTHEEASRYQAPVQWGGEIVRQLPRWTSEAARRLGLARRGVIAQGAAADLVIWDIPAGEMPRDIEGCKPRTAILNGQPVELRQPSAAAGGRFIGRN
ncbi:MAG: M14 family zinc carboxypeptidase [Acidobacteriota bacterium]